MKIGIIHWRWNINRILQYSSQPATAFGQAGFELCSELLLQVGALGHLQAAAQQVADDIRPGRPCQPPQAPQRAHPSDLTQRLLLIASARVTTSV